MLVQRDIKVVRTHGAHVVKIGRRIPRDKWAAGKRKAVVIEPRSGTMWSTFAGIARKVRPLIEVGGTRSHRRRNDRDAGAQIRDHIECPPSQEGVADTTEVYRHALAERQVIGRLT